tara:strand:+ start:6504 stop:7115 length:612 start_codon:yes stop_codon:yes gene_type:complete
MSFKAVSEFENEVATFFGAPYGVAVDCCTHGIELVLRMFNVGEIVVPKRTYLSVPFLANKLNINLRWKDEAWEDYYYIDTDKDKDLRLIDAAVLWKEDSYKENTFMCLSFQFQKHLSLGRGGMILTDNVDAMWELKKMSYDGRIPDVPWRDQNIETIGYHYYMSPETAMLGSVKLHDAINTKPRKWRLTDWPDLTKMKVFQGF